MIQYELQVKNRLLQVKIIRKNVKNINLRVTPYRNIYLSAHPDIHIEIIKDYIERKKDWIYKKVKYFEQFSFYGYDKKYEGGETFLYLGKQYRIKLIQDSNNEAKLIGKFLKIYARNPDDFALRKKIANNWYRDRAKAYLAKLVHKYFPKMRKYGYELPYLKIHVMKTRWGSYSPKTNTIYINSELIKTPKSCIEYIIIHELVHLRFHKHNRDFYHFLTILLPDWKKRKKLLESQVLS